jgi:threonine dehydratase
VADRPLEADLERSLAAARATRARIVGFVRRTPLVPVELPAGGARLLKLETLQRTGSFKVRGAAAALSAAERPRLVIAASTGNHGLAVAAVARALELPCRVFVPAAAATAKLERLRTAGVELVEVAGDPLLAELAAREAAESEPGSLLVAPYNDRNVVLGQATLGLELLEDCAEGPERPRGARALAALPDRRLRARGLAGDGRGGRRGARRRLAGRADARGRDRGQPRGGVDHRPDRGGAGR